MVGVRDRLAHLNQLIIGELVAEEKAGGVIECSPLLVLDCGDQTPVSVVVCHYPPSLPIHDWLLNLNVVHSNIFYFHL